MKSIKEKKSWFNKDSREKETIDRQGKVKRKKFW